MQLNASAVGRLLEDAWPAHQVVDLNGWRLRYAGGVTKRANSVLPVAARGDLDAAITEVEEFYAARGASAAFMIGGADPRADADLDAVLATRGYQLQGRTSVLVRSLDVPQPASAVPLSITDSPSAGWLSCWWQVDGRGGERELAAARRILTGVPSRYASVTDEGSVAAVGRLTVTGGWAGIYCMAVRRTSRRRGLGTAVLTALLSDAARVGVRRAYLAVLAGNAPATGLYLQFGFRAAAAYHYRVR